MKYILVVILLITRLISFSQVNNGKWVFVCNGKDGDPYYLMSPTILNQDSTISVWIKQTKKKFNLGKTAYSNVIIEVLEDINCKLNKEKDRETFIYSNKGRVIYKSIVNNEWHDIIHNSYGEIIINKACELFNN